MPIPTVEEAAARANFHLGGDSAMRRFPMADLQIAVGSAWEETIAHMITNGVSAVELTQLYTLPASISTLLPFAAGISNFGGIIRLWEKPSGSTYYLEMDLVDILPQVPISAGRLYQYRWTGNQFEFLAIPAAVDLKIEYRGSGKAPDSGSLGFDGCLNVVAKLAAAIAGAPKGMTQLAASLRNDVYGDNDPSSPKHMHHLVQPMLKVQQSRDGGLQRAAYQTGGRGGQSARRIVNFV